MPDPQDRLGGVREDERCVLIQVSVISGPPQPDPHSCSGVVRFICPIHFA